MEFLGTLQTDVKLLLVGSALALLAGLVTGSKKMEHRYMAVFTVLMVVAGWRFHVERQQELAQAGRPADAAVKQVKGGTARTPH